MNKYRDKSDFEINKAVAEKSGRQFSLNGNTVFMRADETPGIVTMSYIFDPCNYPADAFPLIIDVKLSIHPDFYNDCESWIVRTVHIPTVKDKSLTRAICIAYLYDKLLCRSPRVRVGRPQRQGERHGQSHYNSLAVL